MMERLPRIVDYALAAALSLFLAGCLLLPGTFTSELTTRRDGTFSFAYKGDIHLVGLSKAADETSDAVLGEFTPSFCQNDETSEERPCTEEELAQQKSDWEAGREAAKKKREQHADMMQTILGGIDPTDPKASEEFAERLRRQAGWRSVIDRGNGRFEVDFAIKGRLDHDLVFPTIERMPVVTPFVTVARRADGSVRIDAPAFRPGSNSSPMMSLAGAAQSSEEDEQARLPKLDGTFVVVTDGEILANNTEEGATASGGSKRLSWKVNARTPAAPSALIQLR